MDEYSFYTKLDFYILSLISKDFSISQAELYLLGLINYIRNMMVFIFFILLSYPGSLKKNWNSLSRIAVFAIPFGIYWLIMCLCLHSYHLAFLIDREYMILFSCGTFLFLTTIFYRNRKSYFLIPTEKVKIRWGCLLAILVAIIYLRLVPYIVSFFITSPEKNEISTAYIADPINTIPVFYYALVVACTEEMFWRGIIFNYLYRETTKTGAFLISGILFAFYHFTGFYESTCIFLFSIISSALLLYTRTIYIPILAHFMIIFLYRSVYGF